MSTTFSVETAIQAVWIATGLVWAAAAVAVKRAVRREAAGSRIGHLVTMAVAFGSVFSPALRYGPLAWRAVPASPAAEWTGLAMTAAGAALAIWARVYLGGNWSAIVALKQGHTLVRTGPYRLVRHPIYAGLLLAMLGSAIAYGHLGGLLGVVVAFAAFLAKARLEECFLLYKFGEGYEDYRRKVRTLIPFVL